MDDRFRREEEEFFRRNRGLKESIASSSSQQSSAGHQSRKFTNFRNRKSHRGNHSQSYSEDGPSTSQDWRMKRSGSGGGRGGRKGGGSYSGRDDGPRQTRGGHNKHPPHLKGKQIGLYYAKLSKEKQQAEGGGGKKKRESKMEGGVTIALDPKREQQIRSMLLNLPQHLASSSTSSTSSFIKTEPGCSDAGTQRKPDTIKRVHSSDDVSIAAKYNHLKDSHFKRNFLRSLTESIDSKIERLLQRQIALERNPSVDKKLKDLLLDKKKNSKAYISMYEGRKKLPSFKMQDTILRLIHENQVVVVSGETGCGKTTQVAQFILDDYILRGDGSLCRILCTQPRRISATSVAERVASERDEKIGSLSVGYQIRLEKAVAPKQGSILYCTTGILLEWMQSDPSLADTSHIILDEIHERDTVSDFVITLLRDILPKRPDLKIILMSATLNADHFSKYFNNCPSINIPGFTFPVEELYLEDVIEMLNFRFPFNKRSLKKEERKEFEEIMGPYLRSLERSRKYSRNTIEALGNPASEEINYDLMSRLIEHICKNRPDGAILVFLPGWEQISKLNTALTSIDYFKSSRFRIIPLHSLMPTTVQRSVFERPPHGTRKIIIATNIAETSITIDDVVYVVDCGKIKMKNYDTQNNIQTLQPEWVSLANAKQRRGRAGRVQPGICYHLYSRAREMTLQNYQLPEMLRSRLDEVIIRAKMLQLGAVRPFLNRVMNPPDPMAVDHSLELLTLMDVLDSDENLTPLGYHVGKLPVDPNTGKMLLMGALFSCVDPVCSVAASLSFKDAFMIPLGKEKEVDRIRLELSEGRKSDLLLIGDVLIRWEEECKRGRGGSFCWENFLSQNTLTMLRDLKKQFVHYLYDMKFLKSSNPMDYASNVNSNNASLVKAIICAGLYPNVAYLHKCRTTKQGRNIMKLTTPQDGRVVLHPKSVNDKESHFPSPFFVYHMKLKSANITLHDSTMVYPLPILFFGESLRFFVEEGVEKIAVGKYFQMRCKRSIASIVMDLREHMNRLLEYRASHPDVIPWENKKDPHTTLLRAIVELITYEDAGIVMQDSSDEDSDSDVIILSDGEW
ncbi:ATP-dependent DNA/RNA helicase DHX36 [Frankliniella fusca]|uniref:RNA helicase n=1 Tax=Frankliniella fusca TaxID=407009 RepID=A0AAE1GZP5_9NEOP|nr:ATP-dependent DNA/RNA helicase DHX36 [Frankliniella fusca]